MKKIAPAADPELLLGFDTSDDAAVAPDAAHAVLESLGKRAVVRSDRVHPARLDELESRGEASEEYPDLDVTTRGKISLSMVKGK